MSDLSGSVSLSHQSWGARLFVTIVRILFSLFFSRRVKIAEDNIKRSTLLLSHLDQHAHARSLAKESLNHLGLTLYQSLLRSLRPQKDRVNAMTLKGLSWPDKLLMLKNQGIDLYSETEITSLIQAPRGIIFVSAHIGAWEELIMLQNLIERPLSIISKRMSIQWTQKLWDRSRGNGPTRIDHGPIGQRARRLTNALKAGECIGAVLDQHDPRSSALRCTLLGRAAATSPDLIRAALLTDAVIVPVFMFRTANARYKLHIFSTIDPRATLHNDESAHDRLQGLTQLCCDQIERAIRMRPEQWMWIHRRWKLD